jgi:branched-chain amino acid transport system ATP-binding protein
MAVETLQAENISKRFGGVAALSEVSIQARPREITGLIGPNGAGKTTLFNCITGFLKSDSGMVYYGDRKLTGRSPARIATLGVARTFQDVRIFKGMTALENLEVALRRGQSIDAALELLALAARTRGAPIPLALPAGSLSFGDQKFVAIARTLALGAEAILLDEPASGLDEEGIEVLLSVLASLKEAGKLVLLVEHNMSLVMSTCDRLFVLASGRLIAEGTPAQVQANRDVIDAYLGVQGEGREEEQQDLPEEEVTRA